MTTDQAKQLQSDLAGLGLYRGPIDGLWGAQSAAAWSAAREVLARVSRPRTMLAWGARVSEEFRSGVLDMARGLQMPADGPSWLMACMAWESAETFRADVRNMAGSGATGLIQFMPATAAGMGTSTEALASMTPEAQLQYVRQYFEPYRGRLTTLGDVYMAILWPAGIGRADSFVLWDQASKPTTYRQNAGLDIDRNGAITRWEAIAKVREKLDRGLQAGNAWELSV